MEPIELSRYRCSQMNPFAPPDRRYRLVKTCHAQGYLPSLRRDDQPTWEIWKFVEKRAAANEPKQRIRVLKDYHDLSIAFRLHHGELKHFRPLIEAYLLACADDDTIANKVSIPPEAIGWFRLAFYDVAQHLESPQYVLLHLIGIFDADGQTTLGTHKLWKLIAYTLGADALDQFLHNPSADRAAFKGGGLDAWFAQRSQAVLRAKEFLAANNLNPNDQKHVAILSAILQQSAHGQRQSASQPRTEIEQHIAEMLKAIPWCKGPEHTPEPVREWNNSAVVLRDEELLLLATGEKLPHLDEWKGTTFPVARIPTRKEKPNTTNEQ